MARIMISLETKEKAALIELALQEYRDPRAQAALIIRRELERKNLLPSQLKDMERIEEAGTGHAASEPA